MRVCKKGNSPDVCKGKTCIFCEHSQDIYDLKPEEIANMKDIFRIVGKCSPPIEWAFTVNDMYTVLAKLISEGKGDYEFYVGGNMTNYCGCCIGGIGEINDEFRTIKMMQC